MFSRRADFNLQKNQLTLLLEKKRRNHTRILDLTESNPTVAGFVYPEETILKGLMDREILRYQPTAKGLPEMRKAIAGYYLGRGVEIPVDDILLTASTSEAYSFLFKLLSNPGDEILIPSPSYPLFEFLASLEGVQTRRFPLYYDNGWHYDLSALESRLTEKTKAIVIVNPNNPTGSFIAMREWEILTQLASSRSTTLICDEVFIDYSLSDGFPQVDPVSQSEVPLFIINGLSKTAGLPQFKLGWIVVRGPADHKEKWMEHLEVISDTFLSVSTPIQQAGPSLMKSAQEVRSQIRTRIRANYDFLTDRCRESTVQCLSAQGGWYANLRLPRIKSEEEWTLHFLEFADTLVHPGYFYDFPEEAFVVISLLPRPQEFREGVKRLLDQVCSSAIC